MFAEKCPCHRAIGGGRHAISGQPQTAGSAITSMLVAPDYQNMGRGPFASATTGLCV
jgi:hypothetical protein